MGTGAMTVSLSALKQKAQTHLDGFKTRVLRSEATGLEATGTTVRWLYELSWCPMRDDSWRLRESEADVLLVGFHISAHRLC